MFISIIMLFVVLQLTNATADGYLEGCPFDTRHQIDGDPVIGVLGDFYKHLIFANAVTVQRHERHNGQVMEEVTKTIGSKNDMMSMQLTRVISLLETHRFRDAIAMCNNLGRDWDNDSVSRQIDRETRQRVIRMAETYLCFFRAEAHRLMGNTSRRWNKYPMQHV